MRFTGLCLITKDVPRLVGFYTRVFAVQAEGDELHSVLRVDELELTLFSIDKMEEMAPRSTAGIGYGNAIIGFEVGNVDGEYERIVALGVRVIMRPTTHPWGSRSFWFTDPDGNVVDFYMC